MRGLGLRELPVRLRLCGMDKVGKLDRILDEEDRNVVANEVEIAFLGVEFNGEPANIAREIARAFDAGNRRKPCKDWRSCAFLLKECRSRLSADG
jgi:hypothetical protein